MTGAVDLSSLAMDRYDAGALDEATAICRAVLAKVPDHSRCQQILGLIALQRGQGPIAEAHFSVAVRSAPEPDPVLHGGWATSLLWSGRTEEALREARKSLALDPASSFGSRLMAENASTPLGRPEGRVRLKRILALVPEDDWATTKLALFRKEAPVSLAPAGPSVPADDGDEAGDFATLRDAIESGAVALAVDLSQLSRRKCPLVLAFIKRRVIYGYVAAVLAAAVLLGWPYGVGLAALVAIAHPLLVRPRLDGLLRRRAQALLLGNLDLFLRMWRFGGVTLTMTSKPDTVFTAGKDDWRMAVRALEAERGEPG